MTYPLRPTVQNFASWIQLAGRRRAMAAASPISLARAKAVSGRVATAEKG
jgi:hypothetical protein